MQKLEELDLLNDFMFFKTLENKLRRWFEIQQMWREDGIEEGFAQGQQLEFCNTAKKLFLKGKTLEEIANLLDKELSEIEEIVNRECITL